MEIAVVGASGDVGRHLVFELVKRRVVGVEDLILLVGRKEGPSAKTLYGLRSDLADAYMEVLPEVDVVLTPREVRGDLVLMCTGITFPKDPRERTISRRAFAKKNAQIFESYARALTEWGSGKEVVIQVSNPIEVGVHIFSRHLDRCKVIGMGAYLDSLRFRREIALALGVNRRKVKGFVVGEHGPHLVPLWSTVSIQGLTSEEEEYVIKRIRGKESDSEEALEKVLALLCDEGVEAAFAKVDSLPFDIRPIVRPFVTHYTGSKTIVGPAAATCDLIESMLSGKKFFSTCQVKVEGEFYGLCGVFGVPVILNREGIDEIHKIPLWEEELEKLKEAVKIINESIRSLG